MKKSDRILAASVIAALDTDMKDKTVTTIGNRTTVTLHGCACLIIDRKDHLVHIDGNTICSRKSSRVINSIIEPLTGAHVESHNGKWFIRTQENGKPEEFTGRSATLKIKGKTLLISE